MDSQPTDKVEGVGDDFVRPPRRHCQRPQLVTPQRSRVTLLIEQYLLCSTAQLTSCSSPAATVSWLTSSMLPHVIFFEAMYHFLFFGVHFDKVFLNSSIIFIPPFPSFLLLSFI
jgi:hypothetical protein